MLCFFKRLKSKYEFDFDTRLKNKEQDKKTLALYKEQGILLFIQAISYVSQVDLQVAL